MDNKLSQSDIDRVIEMAWEDRTTFDAIETQYGLNEQRVKELMRENLKSSSYKLWRKRVGEEKANKITKQATTRGTSFHQHIEDYLRKEKEFIEFENVLQEGMFKAVQPILDEIIPIALEAPLYSNQLRMAGRVDCVGLFDNNLSIIDFKSSSKPKEEYMAKQWYIQMTAYALMVEELTGKPVEEITAIVGIEGLNTFQIFTSTPDEHIEDLVQLRKQYENLYGI